MHAISIRSQSHAAFIDITSEVQRVVTESGVEAGVCHLFVPHTTAGLVVNESWDPSVREDIINALSRIVPMHGGYGHREGNAAAHIKACLTGNSSTLIVEGGQVKLGTWQGIFFAEFDGPRNRKVWVHVT